MIEDLIKTLTEAKARAVTLERSVAKKIHKELRTLPKVYGFEGLGAFIEALKASATGAGRKVKLKAVKRRKRIKITAAIRAQVKKLIGAGKTGAEIAREVGISLPSVQNIKKALGLVGPKKKAARRAAVPKAPAKAKSPVKRAKKKASRKAAVSKPIIAEGNSLSDSAASAEPVATEG